MRKNMVCRKCGKEIGPEDKFCSACGTPVGAKESKNKEIGYKDDVISTVGRFDGKYMLMAGIILVVLAVAAFVVKMNYNKEMEKQTPQTETVAAVVELDEGQVL